MLFLTSSNFCIDTADSLGARNSKDLTVARIKDDLLPTHYREKASFREHNYVSRFTDYILFVRMYSIITK